MLGFTSVDEVIGTSMQDLYATASDRGRFVAELREKKQLESYRVRLCRRDGRLDRDPDQCRRELRRSGALVELRGYLIDVTASVEAESALLVREQLFRAVFYGASDAMMLLDDRRAIIDANPAASELFGTPLAELTGEVLDNLFIDENGSFAALWRELIGLGEAKQEHRVKGARDRGSSNAAIEPACTRAVTCASRGTSPIAGCSRSVWPRPRASRAWAGWRAASRTISTTC